MRDVFFFVFWLMRQHVYTICILSNVLHVAMFTYVQPTGQRVLYAQKKGNSFLFTFICRLASLMD